MKNKFQFAALFILFVQVGIASGQNVEASSEKREKFGTETHLNFILKLVDTDFNYGKSNQELAEYKSQFQVYRRDFHFRAASPSGYHLCQNFTL